MASEDIFTVVKRILAGEKINITFNKWNISNLNSPKLLEMIYLGGKAIFGFNINSSEDLIVLQNYHREAEKGKGTEALQQIEAVLSTVARQLGKKIVLVLPKFGQEDTARWLEKNNYRKSEQKDETYYTKEFS